MSTTLDLRTATRLFYGGVEATSLQYGATVLWTKPTGGGGDPAPEIVYSGTGFRDGDPATAAVIDLALAAPALTEGRGLLVLSGYDSSFNHYPTWANVTLTPLDGTGTALAAASAATSLGFNDNGYTSIGLWEIDTTAWPSGAVTARVTLDVGGAGTGSETRPHLYDLKNLAGIAREAISTDATTMGVHSLASTYTDPLVIAVTSHRRPLDHTAITGPSITLDYPSDGRSQAAHGSGSPVSFELTSGTGTRTVFSAVFYDAGGS